MALTQERQYFTEHLPEWQSEHANQVVLVKGNKAIGFFDDENKALAEGMRRFGMTSFLVRRVAPYPDEVQVPALALGILHANPERSTHG